MRLDDNKLRVIYDDCDHGDYGDYGSCDEVTTTLQVYVWSHHVIRHFLNVLRYTMYFFLSEAEIWKALLTLPYPPETNHNYASHTIYLVVSTIYR